MTETDLGPVWLAFAEARERNAVFRLQGPAACLRRQVARMGFFNGLLTGSDSYDAIDRRNHETATKQRFEQ